MSEKAPMTSEALSVGMTWYLMITGAVSLKTINWSRHVSHSTSSPVGTPMYIELATASGFWQGVGFKVQGLGFRV